MPAEWAEAAGALAGARVRPPADDPAGPDCYRIMVERGDAIVLRVERADAPAGYIVARVETFDEGRELVIVAAAGGAPGADLTAETQPLLEAVARRAGCRSMRCHTVRPGLMAKLERHGWRPAETIMRKVLA